MFLLIILSWEIKKVPPELMSPEQINPEIVLFQKAQKPKQKQDEAEWRTIRAAEMLHVHLDHPFYCSCF